MMKTRPALSTMASAIALFAAQPTTAAPHPPISLESVVTASRIDRAAVDALYRQAVTAGTVAALHDRAVAIAGSSASAHARALALVVDALIDWQRGFLDQAGATADRALAIEAGPDVLLLKARIRDALGDRAAADWYDRALPAVTDPAERAAIGLRAMLLRGDGKVPVGATPAIRDHLAQVAALLGRPGPAAAAFVADAANGPVAAQHVLVAQWALAANDMAAARRAAREAWRTARDPIDRRYALALLAESYRQANDLPGLVAALAAWPAAEEVEDAKLDALLELGRFDAAIALARGGDAGLQRRLPTILDLARRRPAQIAEYRRLIAAQPHDPRGYDGLAALYMADGDADRAVAVYRELLAANRGSVAILTAAARRMIGMGLVAPALAMVRTLGDDPAALVPVQMFLFETERAQGDATLALAVLDRLRARLPTASPARIAVSDGYESLDRRDLALATLAALEAAGGVLGYDQAVHAADLAAATGHPADALARLRRLQAGAALPARRAFLNGRIAALARDAGTLDALARDLDARLANGTIGAADLELLLRIREDAKDVAGAQAVIASYAARAGMGDAERLRQLAAVYSRQQDHARLNDTYRRLIAVDPGQAADYRRRLIQNVVRGRGAPATPAQRQQELATLLGESGAADRTFTAGVYDLAGLAGRAIDEYRIAAAAAPGDTDLVLRLALLLDRQGRSGEALAMLQYQADTANDAPALLAAVDGILTVATRGGGDRPGFLAVARARLLWAERLLLARIAAHGADGQMLAALSDVAAELGDFDLQRRALEDALALATGDGRVALLRQLIAMVSVRAAAESGPSIGDARAQLRYGRRLIALRKQLPPDVYTDLARVLLAQGDVAGAESAFALLEDIPGLVNTDAARGDAFLAAGYRDRALTSYARGLLRSQDDIDLLLRTSILRETMGEDALADRWYWQALRRMIARQPTTGDPTQDARWYRDTLIEGLVMTWQRGTPAAAAIRAEVLAMAAPSAATAGADQAWPDQLRLGMVAALAGRIAAATDDPGLLDEVDAALAPRFGRDPAYRRAMALLRVRAAGDASVPLPQAIAADVAAQANALDDFGLGMALALLRGDTAAIRARVTQAIAIEAARRAAPPDTAAARLGLRPIDMALLQAAAILPPAEFRDLVLAPLDRTPFRDLILFDLFRASPAMLARLDAAAGAPLVPNPRLAALLVTNDGDPVPWIPRTGGNADNPLEAIPAWFPTDDRLSLYDAYVAHNRATGSRSFLQAALATSLLAQSLDAAQRTRFLAILQRDLALSHDPAVGGTDIWSKQLLALDAAADRRALLIAVAQAVGARFPARAYIAPVLRAWFEGDRATAFALLMRHYEELPDGAKPDDPAPALVKARFATEWRRGADAFLADPTPSPGAIERFYRRYVVDDRYGDFGGSEADRRRYLARLVALAPDEPVYVAGLAQMLVGAADRAALATLLSRYVARHPDDREAATDLRLVELLRGEPATTATADRSGGMDAIDADWIVQMTNRAAQAGPSGPPTFRTLFAALYADLADEHPSLPVVVEVRKRRKVDQVADPQAGASQSASPFAPFLDAVARSPATAPAVLRDIWRRSAAQTPDQQEGGVARGALLQALPALHASPDASGGADDQRLVAALVGAPAVTDELEAELAGLEPVQQQAQQRLYALVAEGLVRQGRAAARTDALLARLASGAIDRFHLQLLAVLLDRQNRVPDAAQLAALAAAVRRTANMGPTLHALLARTFAAAGDYPVARAMIEAAVAQSLFPPTGYIVAASDHVTPADAVADLRRWGDKAAARQTYRRVELFLNMARASGGVPAVDDDLPTLEGAS